MTERDMIDYMRTRLDSLTATTVRMDNTQHFYFCHTNYKFFFHVL